jgi:hypothetical protein
VQGSGGRMRVWFMKGMEKKGGVDIKTSPSLEYLILECSNSKWTKFSATPPANQDKIWKITLTRIPGIRLTIHCNGVEMVNTTISDSTCGFSRWKMKWEERVDGIMFDDKDTASEYFFDRIPQGRTIAHHKLDLSDS